MKIFITFTRRSWHRKKRFILSICIVTILLIGAIILGSVLGKRSNNNHTSTVFDIIFRSGVSDSSFCNSDYSIAHALKDIESSRS